MKTEIKIYRSDTHDCEVMGGRLCSRGNLSGFILAWWPEGVVMGKQTYRYKAVGVIKFSVEDLIFETEEEARELIYDDPGGNVEFAHKNGKTEILELSIEKIEPCEEKKFNKTGKC